ncbi:MAG TPA: DEAD/DEAH box helicase [Chitinophagaceae bacterium]|nr:DEAD/DEAH box helicase [Chitinophagaceae bacterium]
MPFEPRYYQADAVAANLEFFGSKKIYNGIDICPTGSRKSLIIALTAKELSGNTIVFQPSKEILAQNFEKILSYGYRASIYSASGGMKHVDKLTFATIGSVYKKPQLFGKFKNIIIDECHLVNPEEGMYSKFLKDLGSAKVLGLTATPYRLSPASGGAMLKFITRTTPRVFNQVLYKIQNDTLFNEGHLAPLQYFDMQMIDRAKLEMNKAGTDFTEESIRAQYKAVGMIQQMINVGNRILAKRKNLLIFCSLITEANTIAAGIAGAVVVTGKTPPEERQRILSNYKKGLIRCVINVGVLTTGFDYPGLEAVLIGISTMSLSLFYQIAGRVMRPFTYPDGTKKTGWVVDMGGNLNVFGKIETMQIERDNKGHYFISNVVNGAWRPLTNVIFSKN